LLICKIDYFNRLAGQADNTPDGRHPFEILAGEYYYGRARKRYQLLRSVNIALIHSHNARYQLALQNLKNGLEHYNAQSDIEKSSRTGILKQIEFFDTIGDLNNPDNFQTIKPAFEEISRLLAMIREEQIKDLEAGIQYGSFNCYHIEQKLIHQASLEIAIKTDTPIDKELTTLINRMQARAKAMEQQHHALGYLISTKTHYWLGKFYEKAAAMKKSELFPDTLFVLSQSSCNFEERLPIPKNESALYHQHIFYQQQSHFFYRQALIKVQAAEHLYEHPAYAAIMHNGLRGKPLSGSELLQFKETWHESISKVREALTGELQKIYPKIPVLSCQREAENITHQYQQQPTESNTVSIPTYQ